MPGVPAPAKVLVTGASGFIAVQLCTDLLSEDYTVVGSVRSPAKGDYLKNLFQESGDRFSYVIVEDIEKPGAFDEAVKGVDAVAHTASPFHLKADDPQELIGPAVQGTVGVLESIKKNGTNVKRVVITSSVASILEPKDGYTFTEKDWNTYSPIAVEKEGKNAPNGHKYRTSKTLAERAAWDFVEKNKAEIKWDIVTINPPLVFGPTKHQVDHISSLNESISQFHRNLTNPPSSDVTSAAAGQWVDVRDVSKAHVLAIAKDEAGGERFITAAGSFAYQDFFDALRAKGVENIPEGKPGSGKDAKLTFTDGSKATRVLGLKYRTMEETLVDTLQSLRDRFPSEA